MFRIRLLNRNIQWTDFIVHLLLENPIISKFIINLHFFCKKIARESLASLGHARMDVLM